MSSVPALPSPGSSSAPTPTPGRSGYLPTLDGWRAIAVIGVILYHARPITLLGHSLLPLQNWGERGVNLFFAISGILICTRLLEEQRRFGRISLHGFYLRRFFRIQPAAFLFLAAITVLSLAGTLHLSLPATLASLFCYRNYWNALALPVTPDDRYDVHFWSLAVEEHFYLLLPSLLILARKRTLAVLVALSCLALLWPPIAHQLRLTQDPLAYQRTDMALQDLVVPALLAVLLTYPVFRARFLRAASHSKLLLLVALATLLSELLLGGHVTHQITCIGLPLVVAGTMLHPTEWISRLLERRPFLFLGRISYSLYLWQQLFFIRRPELSALHHLQSAPWSLLAVLACAIASYYLVERPLMRLGHRLAPPATPGRPDLRGDLVASPLHPTRSFVAGVQ